jgi:hemoglobin-like flavoprotein
MTPKQVALVQDSFAKVALTWEAAAMLFYDRLFDIAPQTRAMFPDDMIEQRRKLMAMLAGVVKGLGNLEQVLPAASALAKRHVSYGAKAEHYPLVGAALLWTLEKGLGDGWTPEAAIQIRGEQCYHKVIGQSGKATERGFCPNCGSPLTVTSARRPDVLGLQAGSLDDPSTYQPMLDVFTSSAQPWDKMDPKLQKHSHSLSV